MTYQVVDVVPQDKKKLQVCLDNGDTFILYKGEANKLSLFENSILSEEQYKSLKNSCGKIRKLLIASINTAKSNA